MGPVLVHAWEHMWSTVRCGEAHVLGTALALLVHSAYSWRRFRVVDIKVPHKWASQYALCLPQHLWSLDNVTFAVVCFVNGKP